MMFILELSLMHIALVKIVAILWNQNDIRILMTELILPLFLFSKWQDIEDRVVEKVSYVWLPENLKGKITSCIKPIGLEILKWMEYHCTGYLNLDLSHNFYWTLQGKINKKKTAEMLIKDECVDIIKRYRLACIYCLENHITELWNGIPQTLKESFLIDDSTYTNEQYLVSLWSNKMEGLDKRIFSNIETFQICAKDGKKEATEYFFQKLTLEEREKYLVSTSEKVKNSDVLYFLLEQMDEQQQVETFKNNSYQVMKCFIDWPLQAFFTKVTDNMWNFITEELFDVFLTKIVHKIRCGYKDYNYQGLFEDFWKKSSDAHKSYIIGEHANGNILLYLLGVKDKENLKLLLRNVSQSERKKLIYNDWVQIILKDLFCENQWDLLRIFIHECLPSKEELLMFKRNFEKYFINSLTKEILFKNKPYWEELFILPDVCD